MGKTAGTKVCAVGSPSVGAGVCVEARVSSSSSGTWFDQVLGIPATLGSRRSASRRSRAARVTSAMDARSLSSRRSGCSGEGVGQALDRQLRPIAALGVGVLGQELLAVLDRSILRLGV